MNPNFEHSAQVLEFNKIIDILQTESVSDLGNEKILALEPLKSVDDCIASFNIIDEIKQYTAYNGAIPLDNLRDLREQIKRAKLDSMLREEELYHILQFGQLVLKLQSLKDKVPDAKYPLLRKIITSLMRPSSIVEEFPSYLEDPGRIRDNATPKLSEITSRKKRLFGRIQDILSRMLSSTQINSALQEKLITTRDGRYVLLVRAESRKDVKGIIHDKSGSGATLYIEPLSILPLNNEIKELDMEEKEERERIIRLLTSYVKTESDILEIDTTILAELDFVCAKTKLAERFKALAPEIVKPDEPMVLRKAVHPLLIEEHRKKGLNPIPLDLDFPIGVKCIIITGPNMGGKTVVLKSVGLLTLMALSGLQIPASPGTRIPFFPKIIADIGEEQSIEFSLSSFASHIRFYEEAVRNAGDGTLVLLDEFGSATDPDEGSALAQSLSEYLVDNGTTLIMTTHLGQLKSLPSWRKDFANAGMEFDKDALIPTYKLFIGSPGRSWAFQIAEKLGLPKFILDRARKIRPRDVSRLDEISEQLGKKLRDLDERETKIIDREKNLKRDKEYLNALIESYNAKAKELESAKLEFAEKKEQVLEEFLIKERRRIVEEIQKFSQKQPQPIEQAIKTEKTISRKIRQMGELRELAKTKEIVYLNRGDSIYIPSLRKYGDIEEGTDKNGYARVMVDGMKMRMHTSLLQKANKGNPIKKESGISYEQKDLAIMIDVRGFNLVDAKEKIIPYIDQAIVQRFESFVIIHGQGKGRLGDKVRGYLKEEKRVESFRMGEDNEGGDGVTIVTLKLNK